MTHSPAPIHIKTLILENQRTPGFPRLADLILEQPECLGELVEVATTEDVYPFQQYASWLLLHVARKNSLLVQPFYRQVIDCILTTKNNSARRNLLGVSVCLPLTDYEQGTFLNYLLSIIGDYDSKPGLVHYSKRKLGEFVKLYPELKHEIEEILELRKSKSI